MAGFENTEEQDIVSVKNDSPEKNNVLDKKIARLSTNSQKREEQIQAALQQFTALQKTYNEIGRLHKADRQEEVENLKKQAEMLENELSTMAPGALRIAQERLSEKRKNKNALVKTQAQTSYVEGELVDDPETEEHAEDIFEGEVVGEKPLLENNVQSKGQSKEKGRSKRIRAKNEVEFVPEIHEALDILDKKKILAQQIDQLKREGKKDESKILSLHIQELDKKLNALPSPAKEAADSIVKNNEKLSRDATHEALHVYAQQIDSQADQLEAQHEKSLEDGHQQNESSTVENTNSQLQIEDQGAPSSAAESYTYANAADTFPEEAEREIATAVIDLPEKSQKQPADPEDLASKIPGELIDRTIPTSMENPHPYNEPEILPQHEDVIVDSEAIERTLRPNQTQKSEAQPSKKEEVSEEFDEKYARGPRSVYLRWKQRLPEMFSPLLDKKLAESYTQTTDKKYEKLAKTKAQLDHIRSLKENTVERIAYLIPQLNILEADTKIPENKKVRERRRLTNELQELAGKEWASLDVKNLEKLSEESMGGHLKQVQTELNKITEKFEREEAEIKNYETSRKHVLDRVDAEFEKKLLPHEKKLQELNAEKDKLRSEITTYEAHIKSLTERLNQLNKKPKAHTYLKIFNSPIQKGIDSAQKLIEERKKSLDKIITRIAPLEIKISSLGMEKKKFSDMGESRLEEYKDDFKSEEETVLEHDETSVSPETEIDMSEGKSERDEPAHGEEIVFHPEQRIGKEHIDAFHMPAGEFINEWNTFLEKHGRKYKSLRLPPLRDMQRAKEGKSLSDVLSRAKVHNEHKSITSLQLESMKTPQFTALLRGYMDVYKWFKPRKLEQAISDFRTHIYNKLSQLHN